jgi:hypothetical protein
MGPKQYQSLVHCIDYVRKLKEEDTWVKGTWDGIPGGTEDYRKYLEKQHTTDWAWIENGKLYEVHISVTCSYEHYYIKKKVTVDGKKTDFRSVSASLKRMEEEKTYQDRRRQED